MPTNYLDNGNYRIAYSRLKGKSPGVIFCGGFRSNMEGEKALALEAFCKVRGQGFLRFDYFGHGQSEGDFEQGTIGLWLENTLSVLDKLTKGPQLLVGSSMGGWLALLTAIKRPRRVCGIVTIAAAPDFTEYMIERKLTKQQQAQMMKQGKIDVPSEYGGTYPITRRFVEEGRGHLLLSGPIPVHCPVHLIHGMKDADVPWEYSLAINEKLESLDVRTTLVEEGDHRLSAPKDLARLTRITERMLERLEKAKG
jgi:pimeloyl-ACP methyl ester carboxylesterase